MGGAKGEFYSGTGSYRKDMVDDYISYVNNFIIEKGVRTVVDLGCGDFHIGSQCVGAVERYIGIDIVEELIHRNIQKFENDKILFKCMDIVQDELPDGDLCLIRQVLQHCKNREIKEILKKIAKYKYVLITEHVYRKEDAVKYNSDIKADRVTRRAQCSGVYLEEPPFSLEVEIVKRWAYSEKEELLLYYIKNNL